MKNIGKITVQLWRIELGKKVPGCNKNYKELKGHQRVPEKALKGQAASLETT